LYNICRRGAIHGHPMGAEAGAKAFRQAIDAVIDGKDLNEYAKTREELKSALEKWN
jgi:2,3-diketo-5-methylthiopentyl-1-phosphate enolase